MEIAVDASSQRKSFYSADEQKAHINVYSKLKYSLPVKSLDTPYVYDVFS